MMQFLDETKFMSQQRPAPRKQATSHTAAVVHTKRGRPAHGDKASASGADMRQLILDTSEHLLQSEGLDALSMREVARRAGVTHQAPYHYFADRASIVAELVSMGFADLAQRLAIANNKAADESKPDMHALMRTSGMAYIGFAIDRPALFSIMFRPEQCDLSQYPMSIEAGGKAYAELGRMVSLVYAHSKAHSGKLKQQASIDALAITYWAQVHGLSCLIVDGPLGMENKSTKGRREFAAQCLEGFVQAMIKSIAP
jgi:AcrR family transcriptional regulator